MPSVSNPMGRPKGSKNKNTLKIKDAMMRAFHRAGGEDYLYELSKTDKPLFVGLLTKIIPSEVQVSGNILIDIGNAMIEAEARQKQLDATRSEIIDVTDSVKVLETKDK